ncbi:hypothetical protein KCTC52924_02982 [Arenibacter antarcticus]|nr:hypothetical protein [Arenibacter sp. H213]
MPLLYNKIGSEGSNGLNLGKLYFLTGEILPHNKWDGLRLKNPIYFLLPCSFLLKCFFTAHDF